MKYTFEQFSRNPNAFKIRDRNKIVINMFCISRFRKDCIHRYSNMQYSKVIIPHSFLILSRLFVVSLSKRSFTSCLDSFTIIYRLFAAYLLLFQFKLAHVLPYQSYLFQSDLNIIIHIFSACITFDTTLIRAHIWHWYHWYFGTFSSKCWCSIVWIL